MKRISTIALFTTLALLAAVSCRKENEQTIEWRTELQVLKSNLVFMPAGGTESLETNLSSISATADKSWCSVSTSGNVVTVTASPNESKQSRYAKLTITSGSETISAAVIQYGEVLDGLNLQDETISETGKTLFYKYSANVPVQMTADCDWIHIEMLDDSDEGTMVKVTVDPNPGLTRFGHVTYTAGSATGTAEFMQYPTPTLVSGWDVSVTDGAYVFPNQNDQITVTPPDASKLYEFELLSKDQVKDEKDIGELAIIEGIFTWIGIQAKMENGSIASPADVLLSGVHSETHVDLPSSIWAVITVFDERGIPTGEYYYKELQIPNRGPVKQVVDGWDITYADGTYTHPNQTDRFTITPKAGFENVKYIATAVNKASVSSIEDYAFTTFAMETREAILAKVASGALPNFDAGLRVGTSTVEAQNAGPDAYVVVIAFGDNQFYTGEYQFTEIAVPDLAYYGWLGEWSVPRGSGADTWIVTENVPGESYKVSGIAGFDADDYAPGAFIAIVPYDPETREMVFKIYENTSVTWQDSSRGTMNALLSGQYTNVEGKTYYNSGVGNTICRAAMADGGKTAELTPRAVTSAGAPAYFYNIRWYGRYTTSSGGRSGVSWTNYETALPNTMTKL